jgi:hypothetical protein
MCHEPLLTWSNVNVVTLCVGQDLVLSGQWGIVVNLDIVEIHPRQMLDVRFQFIRQASFVLCHRNPLAKITANPTEIRSSIPVGLVCHNTKSLIRFDSRREGDLPGDLRTTGNFGIWRLGERGAMKKNRFSEEQMVKILRGRTRWHTRTNAACQSDERAR